MPNDYLSSPLPWQSPTLTYQLRADELMKKPGVRCAARREWGSQSVNDGFERLRMRWQRPAGGAFSCVRSTLAVL